jgi:hypothetical protein
MPIIAKNIIVDGIETPIHKLTEIVETPVTVIPEETHIKIVSGELELLVPKKSSYMMDMLSVSE